jgi:cytochrome P450
VTDTSDVAAAQCPARGVVRISKIDDVIAAVRSKSVLKSPESWAGLIEEGSEHDPALHAAADDLLRGTVSFVDGDDFRKRRRLLNSLMRPEALDHIREHVVLPAAKRILQDALIAPQPDGIHRCELVAVLERIFLESSAKIIGLVDVESDERMYRLRECVFPLFALFQTKYFEDRSSIVTEGREAKRIFVDEFYRPSYEAMRQLIAEFDASEGAELPTNLMRLIATEADESWKDEEVAIRDSLLIFVATVGTSAQTLISTIHDLSAWFETHPEHEHLRTDMGFLTDAFEESIRLRSPFISYITREATDDFVLPSGLEVHNGQQMYIQLPKANRETELFGEDALDFNPLRQVAEGHYRYGLGFSTGPHQCLGLRMVLGNDGRGGSHIKLLKMLLQLGARGDENNPPEILQMKEEEDAQTDIPTYVTFPSIFTEWEEYETVMEEGTK